VRDDLKSKSTGSVAEPTLTDSERESAIDREYLMLANAATPGARRKHLQRMWALVAGRSQAQIERMERERFGMIVSEREALHGVKR